MKKISILGWCIIIYVIGILYMPNAIRDISTIYHVDATSYIAEEDWLPGFPIFPWLNYSLSFLEIIAILWAIFIVPEKTQINFKPLLFIILLINLFRFVIGESSLFLYNDYSLIISLLIGYGCYLILTSSKYLSLDIELILDYIIIINFVTQVLFVVTGRQMEYGGRYGALGTDVGMVGTMCTQYLIYFLFCRKRGQLNTIALICCLSSLFLSGSRTNLLFAVIFICLFFYKLKVGISLNKSKSKALRIVVFALVLLVPILLSTTSLLDQVLDRMTGIVTALFGDRVYFNEDDSLSGRYLSFNAGIKTLIENPLGLCCSTIDLQIETILHGFTTFPHSLFLSYYLLWGVPLLICYFFFVKWMVLHYKQHNTIWLFMLFLIVTSFIYGAPIVSPKSYFWYFLIYDFCKFS